MRLLFTRRKRKKKKKKENVDVAKRGMQTVTIPMFPIHPNGTEEHAFLLSGIISHLYILK